MITFQREENLPVEEFIEILNSSGLGKRRPMNDPEHLQRMLNGVNLILTARENGKLVGVLRALSDFCYRCFVADLAVSPEYQKKGIGRRLLQEARNTGPEARLFLFAAEGALPFYKRLGFHLHDHCFQLKADERLG